MLGRRMVGALLVMGGMTLLLSRGVTWIIEQTDPVYSAIETRTSGEMSLALLVAASLTLVGGIVLLLSSARRVA